MPTKTPIRAGKISGLVLSSFWIASAVMAQALVPPAIGSDTQKEDFLALEPYLGRWASEEKTSSDGNRKFRFLYELAYFDKAETIVELKIFQSPQGGPEALLWHGYKGWDPVAAETYYYGFSPLGRVSRGTVAVVDGDLVTAYSGFDSTGQAVEVVDVFGPVDDDSFENTSFLRAGPEADWHVIARDVWQRSEDVFRGLFPDN